MARFDIRRGRRRLGLIGLLSTFIGLGTALNDGATREYNTTSVEELVCTEAVPMKVEDVTFNRTKHGNPGSGHGYVKCGNGDCAVDIRPWNSCDEAYQTAKRGINIYSTVEGKTHYFDLKGDYGGCMIVTSRDNREVEVLCHIDPIVREGSNVDVGDKVGTLTGYECQSGSFGPHLHYERKKNGKWILGDGRGGTYRNQLKALGCE